MKTFEIILAILSLGFFFTMVYFFLKRKKVTKTSSSKGGSGYDETLEDKNNKKLEG